MDESSEPAPVPTPLVHTPGEHACSCGAKLYGSRTWSRHVAELGGRLRKGQRSWTRPPDPVRGATFTFTPNGPKYAVYWVEHFKDGDVSYISTTKLDGRTGRPRTVTIHEWLRGFDHKLPPGAG